MKFYCVYNVDDMTLNVYSKHDNGTNLYCDTLDIDSYEEYYTLTHIGKKYDFRLALDDDMDYVLTCFPYKKVQGEWVRSNRPIPVEFEEYYEDDEDEDEDERMAECYAIGYRFTCYHCERENILKRWESEPYCSFCGEQVTLYEPEHVLD